MFLRRSTDTVYDLICLEIEGRNIFQLKDWYFWEKICIFLNMDYKKVSDQNEAVAEGEADETDGVIFANIKEFEHYDSGTILEFECSLLDVKNKEIVYHCVYRESPKTVPLDPPNQNKEDETVKTASSVHNIPKDENQTSDDVNKVINNLKANKPAVTPESSCPVITVSAANASTETKAQSNFFFHFPRLKMIIGALLYVLLFPLFTFHLIAGILKVKSNFFSFCLFMFYNVAGWVIVFILTEPNLAEYRSLLFFIGFCLLTLVYNVTLFSWISKSIRKVIRAK